MPLGSLEITFTVPFNNIPPLLMHDNRSKLKLLSQATITTYQAGVNGLSDS